MLSVHSPEQELQRIRVAAHVWAEKKFTEFDLERGAHLQELHETTARILALPRLSPTPEVLQLREEVRNRLEHEPKQPAHDTLRVAQSVQAEIVAEIDAASNLLRQGYVDQVQSVIVGILGLARARIGAEFDNYLNAERVEEPKPRWHAFVPRVVANWFERRRIIDEHTTGKAILEEADAVTSNPDMPFLERLDHYESLIRRAVKVFEPESKIPMILLYAKQRFYYRSIMWAFVKYTDRYSDLRD